ncbi:MAG: hypothetical protein ACI4M3_05725, partial [Acutalibacteraceae bacterium]
CSITYQKLKFRSSLFKGLRFPKVFCQRRLAALWWGLGPTPQQSKFLKGQTQFVYCFMVIEQVY